MLTIDTARRLRQAGVRWSPGSGDRFVVTDRGMDDEVFVLSEMTVEVQPVGQGRVIGFNGTTEWALDSVDDQDALWLPRETQLRELLAGTFRELARVDDQWQVSIEVNGRPSQHRHPDAEEAYGRALLHLLDG